MRKGDRVRLVAPASPFDRRAFERGVKAVARLGFEPVFDRSEFKRTGFLAGADEQRARRFGRALMDPDASAVWFIRGGYGSARLLPLLKWKLLRRYPKVVIGFSDTTARTVSLLAPRCTGMCGALTTRSPVGVKTAQLKSSRSFTFTLLEVFRSRMPNSRAISATCCSCFGWAYDLGKQRLRLAHVKLE